MRLKKYVNIKIYVKLLLMSDIYIIHTFEKL